MVIYYIGHVYLMPYVYSFSQIFQALRLLAALRLFQTLEYSTVFIISLLIALLSDALLQMIIAYRCLINKKWPGLNT